MDRQILLTSRKRWVNRRLLILIYLLSAILLVLLVTALVVSGSKKEDSLKGIWLKGESHIYQFDGFGKGSLLTDDDLSKFEYEIKKDRVRVDYVSDRMSDCIYTFEFDNDSLILIDEDGNRMVCHRKH